MNGAWRKTAPIALLTLAAVTLAACVVEPAPYYGGEAYYARPAPVYVGPRYYYGSHRGYWYRHGWGGGGRGWHGGGWHGGGWHGGGWKGGGHHWD
jgi:hypothetical protein